jgi:hypothetical protein
MFRAATGFLGSCLVAFPAMSSSPRDDYVVKSYLEVSQTVILIHVITSTFQAELLLSRPSTIALRS